MKHASKPRGGIRILAVILCIVLTLSLAAGIIIADIRIATTKENAAKIIRETLFASHTLQAVSHISGNGGYHTVRPQAKLAAATPDENSPGLVTQVMVEWLYDNLTEQYGSQITVTQEDILAFIDESTLKDDISDLAASLINDFITGENTTTLDEATLRALIQENAAVIEKYFGVVVTEDMVSSLLSTIADNNYITQLQQDGIGGLLLNIGSSGGNFSEDSYIGEDGTPIDGSDANPVSDILAKFRKATSIGAIVACFAVAALCAAGLVLLSLKYIWYALRRIGICLAAASLPSLIPTVSALIGGGLWSSTVGAVVAMILKITAPVCISIFAVGAVLIVVSVVLQIAARKKAVLSEATEALSAALEAEEPAPALPEEPAEETDESEPTE